MKYIFATLTSSGSNSHTFTKNSQHTTRVLVITQSVNSWILSIMEMQKIWKLNIAQCQILLNWENWWLWCCILYIVDCLLYFVYHTLYILYCISYILHCILFILLKKADIVPSGGCITSLTTITALDHQANTVWALSLKTRES